MSSSQTMTNNTNTILSSCAKHDCNTLLSSCAKHDCNTLLSSCAKHDCNTLLSSCAKHDGNTLLSSCAKHDGNTNPTCRPSSSEATTQPQLTQTMLTVFSMLHFFMSLTNYIELGYYCSTCRLLFKFKKHTNYKLNDDYSHLYKNDETFRNMVLSRIVNPQKQLYLILDCDFYSNIVTDLSVLGNVYSLNLSGCKITNMCNNRVDLSVLENVHSLNLSSCHFSEIIKINKIDTLNLAMSNISNVCVLKDVYMLNLKNCVNIRDVSPLRNVRYICLSGCRISDLSGLENADTLDLTYCDNITNVSPLSRVRVLDLSYCENIIHIDTLVNVSVLQLSYSCSSLDCSTIVELKKMYQLYYLTDPVIIIVVLSIGNLERTILACLLHKPTMLFLYLL